MTGSQKVTGSNPVSSIRNQMSKIRNKLSIPHFLSFILCFLFYILSSGCQGGGGFQDIALITQAQKELRSIRNALEEYKIDHGTYPAEGTELKTALAKYLSKTVYSEGKEIGKHVRIVLEAQNDLSQITKVVSKCGSIKNEEVKETFSHIQRLLKSYENILNGEDEKITPINEEIVKLNILMENLNSAKLKVSVQDSLVRKTVQIIETTDSLIKGAQEEESNRLTNIKNTFRWYKAKFSGEELKERIECYSPEGELSALKVISDESTIILLQQLINSYYELESSIGYYEFLLTIQKDLNKVDERASAFEKKIEEAKKSAVIVQAQASLHRMADAIRDYRREKGRFPDPNVNIDSLLHPYFIETTMSGEQIDRWQCELRWFSNGPIYRTKDPEVEFEIEARVNDKVRTHIISKVNIQNQWDEIVSTFSELPLYTTPDDPTCTYFLKARAKDNGRTWVTERPTPTEKRR